MEWMLKTDEVKEGGLMTADVRVHIFQHVSVYDEGYG